MEALRVRHAVGMAWHRPVFGRPGWLHVTAACYEHHPLIGLNQERMRAFCHHWLQVLRDASLELQAWCLLPNHYHALLQTEDETRIRKALGRLHGRSSHDWNVEEGKQGRKCFHGLMAKPVRSSGHHWATVNYIHHNPVKHGYAETRQEWPYSSADDYLKSTGRKQAQRIWREYPIDEMGRGWDE